MQGLIDIKKKWKQIVKIYVFLPFVFTLIFFLLFHLNYFQMTNVLFYRGIFFLTITLIISLLLVGIAVYLKRGFLQYLESIIAVIFITTSIHLTLFVLFPVSFDRSLSVSLLNYLEKKANSKTCGGLSRNKLESELIRNYISKNKAVDKRLEEQKIINFIDGNNECIKITDKGINFLQFSNIIKYLYNFD